jgi:hypothetical protein
VRLRGEPNSYNWIEVDGPRLALTIRSWAGAGFATVQHRLFVRRPEGWRALDGVPVEADAPAPP